MTIGKALTEDLSQVLDLLQAARLPVEGVAEAIDGFLVLKAGGNLLGVVGLEIYGDRALLRSLAVAASERSRGHGQRLYEAAEAQARRLGMSEIILLTETAQGFFAGRGYEVIPRAEAGEAVGASVEFRSACPTSAVCMRLRLRRGRP